MELPSTEPIETIDVTRRPKGSLPVRKGIKKIDRVKIEYLLGMSLDHLIRMMQQSRTNPARKDQVALKMMDKHLPDLIANSNLQVSVSLPLDMMERLEKLYADGLISSRIADSLEDSRPREPDPSKHES